MLVDMRATVTAIVMGLLASACVAAPEPMCPDLSRCWECFENRPDQTPPDDPGIPLCSSCQVPRGECPEGWEAACDIGTPEEPQFWVPYCVDDVLRCARQTGRERTYFDDRVPFCRQRRAE